MATVTLQQVPVTPTSPSKSPISIRIPDEVFRPIEAHITAGLRRHDALPSRDSAKTAPFAPQPALCHPLREEVKRQTESYVLQHWDFHSKRAHLKFQKADFSGLACLCFPHARNDRIHHAARLFSIAFLIDDVLEQPGFEDGPAYIEDLLPIMRGHRRPSRRRPVEWMLYDLFVSMRRQDDKLVAPIVDGVWAFLQATIAQKQTTFGSLRGYLDFREDDIGKPMICAVLRFVNGLHLSSHDIESAAEVERNVSRQVCIVNDICSWEKEFKAFTEAQWTASFQGHLCSAVQVLREELGLEASSVQKILWSMVQAWESRHEELLHARMASFDGCDEGLKSYMQEFSHVMAGHKEWCLTTRRYRPAT